MNEQNLIPLSSRTTSEQREIAQKGGIASGQARRERRTVQKLLNAFLDTEISEYQAIAEIAEKYGISTDKSIKDLLTVVCVLNSFEKADLSDLERLMKLLGEVPEVEDSKAEEQAEFLEAIRTAVMSKGA